MAAAPPAGYALPPANYQAAMPPYNPANPIAMGDASFPEPPMMPVKQELVNLQQALVQYTTNIEAFKLNIYNSLYQILMQAVNNGNGTAVLTAATVQSLIQQLQNANAELGINRTDAANEGRVLQDIDAANTANALSIHGGWTPKPRRKTTHRKRKSNRRLRL